MPLQRSGQISASDINTEISATTFNSGKSATAALGLNDSDARSLSGISSGQISYASFYGTFQMYSATDYYYPSLYGYDPVIGLGSISSTSVSGQYINRIAWNGYNSRFEVYIGSASDLGQSWFTSIKLGSTTLNTSGASNHGWIDSYGSYWFWSTNPLTADTYYTGKFT